MKSFHKAFTNHLRVFMLVSPSVAYTASFAGLVVQNLTTVTHLILVILLGQFK